MVVGVHDPAIAREGNGLILSRDDRRSYNRLVNTPLYTSFHVEPSNEDVSIS
jgi:hypothetical protein